MKVLRFFAAAIVAAAVVVGAPPAQARAKSRHAAAGAGLKKDYALCRSRALLDKVLAASVAQDQDEFDGLVAKGCIVSGGREKVKVIEKGQAVIRLKVAGKPTVYWTVVEALR